MDKHTSTCLKEHEFKIFSNPIYFEYNHKLFDYYNTNPGTSCSVPGSDRA